MAKQNIKLEKTIISNKESNNLHTKDFNQLAKSDIKIDEEKIIDVYDSVFYNTPKKGTYSHTTIVEKIYNYINYLSNQRKEQQIDSLTDQVVALNERLDEQLEPEIRQHPIYDNGSFLIAGEDGKKYDGNDTVYIMQEGYKRPFKNEEIYKAVRKALDLPFEGPNLYGDLYYVNLDELNGIDEGRAIETTSDLNITGKALDVEDTLITTSYSSYIIKIRCQGTEIQDISDNLITEPDALFYYDGGCKVNYYGESIGSDPYQLPGDTPSALTIFLDRDEEVILRIGRNNDEQTFVDGVPQNVNYITPTVQYNGNNVQNYVQNWGINGKYKGFISIDGRVLYKELGKDSKTYSQDEISENYKVLNGLPSNFSIAVNVLGEEESSYGTRIIYPKGSNLYGDQNHEDNLQQRVFNDPSNIYYRPEFYGQPIFRANSDYVVLVGNIGDATVLLSLDKEIKQSSIFMTNVFYNEAKNWGWSQDILDDIKDFPCYIWDNDRLEQFNLPQKKSDNSFNWTAHSNNDDYYDPGRLRYKGIKTIGSYGYQIVGYKKGTKNGTYNGAGYPLYLWDSWVPW